MFALAFMIGLLGCDSKPPADSAAVPLANAHPVASTDAAPLHEFRDWPRDPPVDPAEIAIPALRIVSGAPNLTEICCALGLRGQLVGRTRFCTYPPEVESVPAIGGLVDGSAEALVALKPDVVLVAGSSRALVERLAPLGLTLESLPDRSIDDLFTAIERLGERFHRPRTAHALIEGIRRELKRAAASAATPRAIGAGAPTALLLTGTLADPPRPPFVAGPGSFYDDLLRRAGLYNIVADTLASFAPVSLEFIVARDPAFIFELDPADQRPGGDPAALAVWSTLGALSAVREKHVHVLRGPQHYILGPRIAQTLDAIVRAVRPPAAAPAAAPGAPSAP